MEAQQLTGGSAEQLAAGVAAAPLQALGNLPAVKGAGSKLRQLRDKLSSASEELPKALRDAPRSTTLPAALLGAALALALLALALQGRASCSFQAAPGAGLLLCRQPLAGHAEVQTALAHVTHRSGWLWSRRQVRCVLSSCGAQPAC